MDAQYKVLSHTTFRSCCFFPKGKGVLFIFPKGEGGEGEEILCYCTLYTMLFT